MRIAKILRCENKGNHALITVQTDDGGEATVYVGGAVEVYFDHRYNKIKAWVKRPEKA